MKNEFMQVWNPRHLETIDMWVSLPNGEVPLNALSKFLRYRLRWWICEACDKRGKTVATTEGPAYASDLPCQHRDNPNRTRMFCQSCKDGWDDYWREMWKNAQPSY